MQNQYSPSEFKFCYNKSDFNSLVMLAPHQRILQQILKDATQPHYLWIFENDQIARQTIEQTEKQIRQKSYAFKSVDQLKEFMTKNKKTNVDNKSQKQIQKAIIICQQKYVSQSLLLTRQTQFIGVIQYNHKSNIAQTKNIQNYHNLNDLLPSQSIDKVPYAYKKCKNLKQLCKQLNSNEWILSDSKQFPNFISLKSQINKSSTLTQSLMSMVNENIDKETKTQILNELDIVIQKLQKLYQQLKGRHQFIRRILKELKTMNLSKKRLFQIYSSQNSKLYVVINIFLRAMNCPTQIFYVQPFLKQLFKAIKFQYVNTTTQQFICFRGSFINQEQADKLRLSTGEVIQNLGFLSASLSQQIAQSFKKNIAFEIQVTHISSESPGFAKIAKYSEFIGQKQILFNPLNYFKILQIKVSYYFDKANQQYCQYYVTLNYGRVETISESPYQVLNENQQIIKRILTYHRQISKKIVCQGDVFEQSEEKQKLDLSLLYWQKCLQQNEANKSKHLQMKKIGKTLLKMGKYLEGLTIYKKCFEQIKQLFGQNHIEYLKMSNRIGFAFFKIDQYNKALQYLTFCESRLQNSKQYNSVYLQCLLYITYILRYESKLQQWVKYLQKYKAIMKKSLQIDQILNLKILVNMGNLLLDSQKYEQALRWLEKCLCLQRDIIGENHLLYLRTMKDISVCLRLLGRYQQSLQMVNNVLSLQRKVIGQNHPLYLDTLELIANTLIWKGQYYEAYLQLKKCLQLGKKVLGQRSSKYLINLNRISDVLRYFGRLQQAIQANKKCLTLQRQISGEHHFNYVLALQYSANILLQSGKYQEALQVYKKCLALHKQMMTQNNYQYLITMTHINFILYKLRRYQQALRGFQNCLFLQKKVFKETNPIYLIILNYFALALYANCHFDKGIRIHKTCASIQKKVLGKTHPRYLQTLNNIAVFFLNIGEYQKAIKIFKTNPLPLKSSNLSEVLFGLKYYQESLFYLQLFLKQLRFQLLTKQQQQERDLKKKRKYQQIQRIIKRQRNKYKAKTKYSKGFIDYL